MFFFSLFLPDWKSRVVGHGIAKEQAFAYCVNLIALTALLASAEEEFPLVLDRNGNVTVGLYEDFASVLTRILLGAR